MSQRFGAQALRLSGLAARALGWPPDIFWRATPAELAAILAPANGDEGRPLNRNELETLLERDHERQSD